MWPQGRLSQKSMRILKNCLNDPLWNHMVPDVEYWDHQRTEDEIKINDYFGENTSDLGKDRKKKARFGRETYNWTPFSGQQRGRRHYVLQQIINYSCLRWAVSSPIFAR